MPLAVYIINITHTHTNTHTRARARARAHRHTHTVPDHDGDRIGVPLGVSAAITSRGRRCSFGVSNGVCIPYTADMAVATVGAVG